jgi:aspartate-semialdehyde dehydrogenase
MTTKNYSERRKMGNKNIAIAGATGVVGREMLNVLEKKEFPVGNLKLLASERSAGKKIIFKNKEFTVEILTEQSFSDIDIALFSAGGTQSKKFAPPAVEAGAVVIDNSSAFRMDPHVPLIIPEINSDDIFKHSGIIANPNCSTIIMLMALYPLHRVAGIERVTVSTYQAASGAGLAAMNELTRQNKEIVEGKPITIETFPHQIAMNLFCHNTKIGDNGYNQEEMKMVNETKKILHMDNIKVSATCVRVPILRAHSESINVIFKNPITEKEAKDYLSDFPGVKLVDDREKNYFPMPLEAEGLYDCMVGRIRQDISTPDNKGLELFVCGDQLLKGAALNAVQIAQKLQ